MSSVRSIADCRPALTPSVNNFHKAAISQRRARPFLLERLDDETGVSGTGVVADGVEWPDGRASLCWRWSAAGTGGGGAVGLYNSVEEIAIIHGHGGRTRVIWQDG